VVSKWRWCGLSMRREVHYYSVVYQNSLSFPRLGRWYRNFVLVTNVEPSNSPRSVRWCRARLRLLSGCIGGGPPRRLPAFPVHED
jgi:hypothetical protein